MQGDENQAERHLNTAFRRRSEAALYCVNESNCKLSNAYYTPTKTTSWFGFTIFGNFEERKKEEIK
jgi:hypothetical protein